MKSSVIDMHDIDAIWEQFTEARSADLREQLVLHYLPLLKVVAGRMKAGMPGSVEYDDLVSAGMLGLINSIDNFNPALGYKFSTYAQQRIRGAILDGLRDADWLPRSVRQKSRQLERSISDLSAKLGRQPDDYEIAEDLGLEGVEFDDFMTQAGMASMVSLDAPVSSGDESDSAILHEVIADEEADNPEDEVIDEDSRQAALKLIQSLSEQERAVVALYYYEELTFREIGKVLGVSESRICQIHTKIITTLRVNLSKLME